LQANSEKAENQRETDIRFTTAIPLTLYIHIPWCVKKCPYCDFNSHAQKDTLPEDAYVEALLNDLENDLPRVWGRRINAIFIGGGTPSLFSGKAIETLLAGIRARITVLPNIEITLEANPGTIEQQRFVDYRVAGVNRLSLGIQSFNPTHLKALGRIHNDTEAKQAIKTIRSAGFDEFNLDLMYGLPQQTLEQALDDLHTAISFQPTHLSWYHLTLEPNTAFYANPPQLPVDDLMAEMMESGQSLLAQSGYDQYEVSAYSKNSHYCQHNLNYWEFGDYLGIGAGAHAKITDVNQGTVERLAKHRHPKDYMNLEKGFIAQHRILTVDDLKLEFMLNALRLTHGFPSNLFQQRTGLPLAQLSPSLENAIEKKLLHFEHNNLKPTPLGHRFLNDLVEMFL